MKNPNKLDENEIDGVSLPIEFPTVSFKSVKTVRNEIYALHKELSRIELKTREQSLAITKLQEAEMWLNKHIEEVEK